MSMVSFVLFQVSVYPCTYAGCGAKFRSKSGLYMHNKRHFGLYMYYCPYCNKGIQSTERVKDHLKKQHTGLYGYHCNKCRQELQDVHLLKKHIEENVCSS